MYASVYRVASIFRTGIAVVARSFIDITVAVIIDPVALLLGRYNRITFLEAFLGAHADTFACTEVIRNFAGSREV